MTNLQDQQTIAGFTPEELKFLTDLFEPQKKHFEDTDILYQKVAIPLHEAMQTSSLTSEETKKGGVEHFEHLKKIRDDSEKKYKIICSLLEKFELLQKP